MNENFNVKDSAEFYNGKELKDELLERVTGGISGGRYRLEREETRYCSWCGNTGMWEVYINVDDPSDEVAMCKTCGNTGYKP